MSSKLLGEGSCLKTKESKSIDWVTLNVVLTEKKGLRL